MSILCILSNSCTGIFRSALTDAFKYPLTSRLASYASSCRTQSLRAPHRYTSFTASSPRSQWWPARSTLPVVARRSVFCSSYVGRFPSADPRPRSTPSQRTPFCHLQNSLYNERWRDDPATRGRRSLWGDLQGFPTGRWSSSLHTVEGDLTRLSWLEGADITNSPFLVLI